MIIYAEIYISETEEETRIEIWFSQHVWFSHNYLLEEPELYVTDMARITYIELEETYIETNTTHLDEDWYLSD